jgi:hypothetical protein
LAEVADVARAYAEKGDAKAEPLIERLRPYSPATADVLSARLALARNDIPAATESLEKCFVALRTAPWLSVDSNELALRMAVEIAQTSPDKAPRLLAALSQPFAAEATKSGRVKAASFIAAGLGPSESLPLLESYEPHVPWAREFLAWRRDTYLSTGHPLAAKAAAELEEFERNDARASSQSPR